LQSPRNLFPRRTERGKKPSSPRSYRPRRKPSQYCILRISSRPLSGAPRPPRTRNKGRMPAYAPERLPGSVLLQNNSYFHLPSLFFQCNTKTHWPELPDTKFFPVLFSYSVFFLLRVIRPPIRPVSFAERLFQPSFRTRSRIPSSPAISYFSLSAPSSSPLRYASISLSLFNALTPLLFTWSIDIICKNIRSRQPLGITMAAIM